MKVVDNVVIVYLWCQCGRWWSWFSIDVLLGVSLGQVMVAM